MPYYRRRRYYPRKRSYKVRLWKVPKDIWPDTKFAHLQLTHKSVTTSPAYSGYLTMGDVINVTNLYDPVTAWGGTTAAGYAQLISRYTNWYVEYARVEVEINVKSFGNAAWTTAPTEMCMTKYAFGLLLQPLATTSTIHIEDLTWGMEDLAFVTMSPYTIMERDNSSIKISKWYNARQYNGIKDIPDFYRLTGSTVTAPADSSYIALYVGPLRTTTYDSEYASTLVLNYKVDFWATFFNKTINAERNPLFV